MGIFAHWLDFFVQSRDKMKLRQGGGRKSKTLRLTPGRTFDIIKSEQASAVCLNGRSRDMKNKKAIAIGAVILAALLVVFGVVWYLNRPATTEGSKTITVEVVHKDESKKTFTCTTTEEFLAPVLVSEGIVEDNQGEFGLYILVADGETADYSVDSSYWALLKDGEATPAGASETPITDGDTFSLVYTVG